MYNPHVQLISGYTFLRSRVRPIDRTCTLPFDFADGVSVVEKMMAKNPSATSLDFAGILYTVYAHFENLLLIQLQVDVLGNYFLFA